MHHCYSSIYVVADTLKDFRNRRVKARGCCQYFEQEEVLWLDYVRNN